MTRLLIIILFLPGCAGWTINGIPADRFKDAGPKEYSQLAGGVGLSFLTHWAGHVIWWEANGMSWSQRGLTHERFLATGEPDWKNQMSGRAGFIGQLLFGTALEFSPWSETWFAVGYDVGTLGNITCYDGRDFAVIDEFGGNSDLERAAYAAWAILLLRPGKK